MTTLRNLAAAAAVLVLTTSHVAATDRGSGRYERHNLVSDGSAAASNVDPHLVNGWGIAFNPNAFVWVNDNGTGVATLYDGNGVPQSLVVSIPAAQDGGAGKPTGIVFNGSNDFVIANDVASAPASFIFATEDGVVAAWAPKVDPTHALRAAATPGAVYKGLALAANGSGHFLYAADFVGRHIDVYDRNFQPTTLAGTFSDPAIPADFAPFNIQNIQGDLYVSYAKREPGDTDETAGPGLGFVDVFDANGMLLRRVATRGKLNAPWGMALAPAGFGRFANLLLVGNFGDGTINAYDPHSGVFQGQLRGTDDRPLRIDGLWGIAFGNGVLGQSADTLFFAAGPNDEENGLYGSITPVPGGEDHKGD